MTYKINEDLYIGNTNKQLKDLLASGGDTLPIGSIIPYGSSTTPSNWLKCDGSAVSRTTYSELFSVIGTLYGSGDGSTTFNLPNLKGKVTIGQDTTDSDFNTIGKTGGEKEHTLTIDEMPSHKHTENYVGVAWKQDGASGAYCVSSALEPYRETGNTGGDKSHNNLQPYIVTNYIIKANHTSYVGEESVVQTSYSTSTTDTYSCNYINSIVESGSNANGSWIKWADGTMICTKRVKFSTTIENRWGNLFDSERLSLGNFSQPFISKPIMSASVCYALGEESRGAMIEAIFDVTGTSAGVCWLCRGQIETVTKTYILDITAIGRWK